MRVKVKNFECGKSYEIGYGEFIEIYFSRKNYVLWFSYDHTNKKSVCKKVSKAAFKTYASKNVRSIVEVSNADFFYDYFLIEERQQYNYDYDYSWSNDYACENYCCSCCGCSCYDYYDNYEGEDYE